MALVKTVGVSVLLGSAFLRPNVRGGEALGKEEETASPDTFLQSETWNLKDSVYAQIKLIPSVSGSGASVKEWSGPWGRFKRFRVEFGYSNGEVSNPAHFSFVEPKITIRGIAPRGDEGDGTTIRLFNAASTVKDIAVTLHGITTEPRQNAEYKVATIDGKGAFVKWDVYVRFQTAKPEYVRDRK